MTEQEESRKPKTLNLFVEGSNPSGGTKQPQGFAGILDQPTLPSRSKMARFGSLDGRRGYRKKQLRLSI